MFHLWSTGTLGSFSLAHPVSAGLCLCLHWASWSSYQPISSACRSTWIYLLPCQSSSLVWFQLHTREGYILPVTQENDQNAECFWFQNWTLILWKHQSSKLSTPAQMDVVRSLSTELGVVSCTTSWELCTYQGQIHQLISDNAGCRSWSVRAPPAPEVRPGLLLMLPPYSVKRHKLLCDTHACTSSLFPADCTLGFLGM